MRKISVRAIPLVIAIIGVAFTFSQGDIAHTVYSSYALLQNHVFDFYDFNKTILVGNDYLLIVYLVFAAWMFPVHALGLATEQSSFSELALNGFELIWAKAGLALLFYFAARVVQKIAATLDPSTNGKFAQIAFAVSPFVFLPVFVMGQYDIIGLLLALYGYLYWLRQDTRKFILFFSLAISFKYLALVIFLPLLLIRARSIRQALLWALLSSAPTLIQLAVFQSNAAFRENVLRQPINLLLGSGELSVFQFAIRIIALCVFAGLALYLIRKKFNTVSAEADFSLTAITFGLTVLLVVVRWNPQWIIYAAPFWALVQSQSRFRKMLAAIEALGFFGLIFLLANFWKNNLDDSMIERGTFGDLFLTHNLRLDELFISDFALAGIALTYAAITAPLIFRLFGEANHGVFHFLDKFQSWLPKPLLMKATSSILLVVATLACYLIPTQLAATISDQLPINNLERRSTTQFHSELVTLEPGETLTQSFKSTIEPLRAIGIDAHTGGTLQNVYLSVNLRDDQGSEVTASIYKRKFRDTSFIGFRGWRELVMSLNRDFRPQSQSFEIRITNLATQKIDFWVDNVRPNSANLELNRRKQVSGSLVSAFYFKKDSERGE